MKKSILHKGRFQIYIGQKNTRRSAVFKFSIQIYLAVALIIVMMSTYIPISFRSVLAADEKDVLAAGDSNFEIVWSSTFGGTGYDEAYSVISVDKANEEDEVEEGYVFTGTISDDAGLEYTALVKTDKEGKLTWEKKFGGAFHSVGRSVAQTRDGGYIIAGINKTTMQSNDKVYVIKTDANGNLEWEKKLDLAEQGYSNTRRRGYSIKEADDGYVIAGSIIYSEVSDALIIKINSMGIVTWAQTFGGLEWDCFYDIEPISDGYIAAGYTEEPNRLEYIVKIGSYGEFIWDYKGIEPESQVKDLIITEGENIVAAGYRNSSISLLKLGIDGVSYWGNVYGQGIGYGVIQLASGDYVIAGDGKAVGVKPNGNKSWEMDLDFGNCYVKSVASSKFGSNSSSMVFAGYKNTNNSDAVLFELTSDRAFLGVSSTNVLKGGTVYLYSPLFLKNGELDKTGKGDVRVKITNDAADGEETWVTLADADPAVIDDFENLDGIYCGSYNVKGSDSPGINPLPIEIELYVDGIKEDSKTVKVISDPDLVVLTDYKQLYKEFLDTGMAIGEDENTNRVPDFYDLMERIKKYAEDHKGIVFDVRKEIATEKGYTDNYSDFSYDNRNAMGMDVAIDEFINNISQVAKFKYVAIIGDDEVVPFYRRVDPTREPNPRNPADTITYEKSYIPMDMKGKNWGNPTLLDGWGGNIMTDIPYASYSNDDPRNVFFPILDAGVGRIFADNASTLIEMINGFETPINVIPEMSKVVIFGLDNDLRDNPGGVNFPKAIRMAVIPGIKTEYKRKTGLRVGPPFQNDYYYWYDGTLQEWGGEDVTEAVNDANIIMIWSHANHLLENTQGHEDLTYLDFQNMKPSPGHIIINAGCHSGYSVSHNNTSRPFESYKPYDEAMVNKIISKQVGYLAPSVYGLGSNRALAALDLLESEFIKALVNYGSGTVGDKLKAAYWNYRSGYKYTHDDISVYAAYGTIYYGLPTQKIVSTVEELAAFQEATQVQELQANQVDDDFKLAKINKKTSLNINTGSISHSMGISVDIPEFKRITGESGKVLFEIPNSSNYSKTAFAPVLPIITKTYILPKNSTVSNVSLENQVYTLLTEQVELETLLPTTKTHGAIDGELLELTNPYPREIYAWSLEERQDGVYLNINITPIQYNPETNQVTLYNKIDLNIDYSVPISTAGIAEVTINNNSTAKSGMSDVPVNIKVNSDSAYNTKIEWIIRDSSGELIETGRKIVSLKAGENQLSFSFDTEGWTSGMKDITVLLKNAPSENEQLKEDFPIASYFSVIPVTGLNLSIDMNERVIEPSENKAVFNAEARDENGIGVTGLTVDEFIVKIDEKILSNVVMSEIGEGSYNFEFAISGITEYIHRLSLNCKDSSGRMAYAEEGFVIRADIKPPEITSTWPSMYRSGIGINEKITIQFDEKILPGTEYDNIQLKKCTPDSDTEVDAEINKSIEAGKLIITPVDTLDLNTIYKVVLPAKAVSDKKSNEFKYPYSFSFITYAEPDETSPYLVSTQPSHPESESRGTVLHFSQPGGTVLQPGGTVLYFSEKSKSQETEEQLERNSSSKELNHSINQSTGITTDFPANSSIIFNFNESIAAGENVKEISWTADDKPIAFGAQYYASQLILSPKKALPFESNCKVILPPGSINDLSGNPTETEYSLEFSVEIAPDTEGPIILSVIPGTDEIDGSDEATQTLPALQTAQTAQTDQTDQTSQAAQTDSQGALVDACIIIKFNELILAGEKLNELLLTDSEGDSIPYTTEVQRDVLVLKPQQNYELNKEYKVIVPSEAVKDLSGNVMNESREYSFSTGDLVDINSPEVAETAPLDKSEGVLIRAEILVYFDESILPGNKFEEISIIDISSISNNGDYGLEAGDNGGNNSESIGFNSHIQGNILILTPISNFNYDSNYQVKVPAGALKDLTGNPTVLDMVFEFRTEKAPDTVPPQLVSTVPVNGATNVAMDTQIVFTFNELLKAGSSFDSILAKRGDNPVTFSKTINAEKLIISVIDLPPSTAITVTIPAGAVADLTGNEIVEDCTLKFTTISSTGGDPDEDAGGEPGEDPGGDPGGDPGEYPGGDPGGEPGGGPGGDPGQGPGGEPGKEPDKEPGGENGTGKAGTGDNNSTESDDGTGEQIIVKGSINEDGPAIANTTGERKPGSQLIQVTVDDTLLNEKLSKEEDNTVISILIDNQENFEFTGITGQTIKNMELRDATLEINTGLGSYSIPAKLFNIDEIKRIIGKNIALSDIQVNVKISRVEEIVTEPIEDALSKAELSIVSPPVEFSIECSYGNKRIKIDKFSAPVNRTIAIPDEVDPEDVTTAILLEPDGTIRNTATRIIEADGNFYAMLTSFTSGTYILVNNNIEFKDVKNHWSKEYVNEMGSRLIVNGVGNGIFNPENDITRAELAVMIIRALGIKASGESEKFTDVAEGFWYSEAINAAREYGIITGYTDNTFRPIQKVTREESIAMISRAMRLLGIENNITEVETQQYLQVFEDGNSFTAWSRKDAAYAVKHKIILGSGGKLMPHNNIKRAEAAAIILRMLRASGLITE